MARTNVIIDDVAAQAEGSKTTAAAILRDANGVRETRSRVLETSVGLGYQRNAILVLTRVLWFRVAFGGHRLATLPGGGST